MKMAASRINWAQFLAEGSELPPDVTFAVMEEVHACLLRASVFLRRHHTFPRQLLEWSMRSHIPSKSRVRVDLNFS